MFGVYLLLAVAISQCGAAPDTSKSLQEQLDRYCQITLPKEEPACSEFAHFARKDGESWRCFKSVNTDKTALACVDNSGKMVECSAPVTEGGQYCTRTQLNDRIIELKPGGPSIPEEIAVAGVQFCKDIGNGGKVAKEQRKRATAFVDMAIGFQCGDGGSEEDCAKLKADKAAGDYLAMETAAVTMSLNCIKETADYAKGRFCADVYISRSRGDYARKLGQRATAYLDGLIEAQCGEGGDQLSCPVKYGRPSTMSCCKFLQRETGRSQPLLTVANSFGCKRKRRRG